MLEALFLYALAEFVFSLSPGPAVFLVMSLALHRGFGFSVAAIGGILVLNTFYFALSATGVGTVLLGDPKVFIVLKYIGAMFLIFIAAGHAARNYRAPPNHGSRTH